MKLEKYDVVIIGYGVATCFFLEEYLKNHQQRSILIIEKGQRVGGLLYSEGKFNFDYSFGGDLSKFISSQEQTEYYQRVQAILKQGAINQHETLSFASVHQKLKISEHEIYHLGRKNSIALAENFAKQLTNPNVEVLFQTEVQSFSKKNELYEIKTNKQIFYGKKLIIATNNNQLIESKYWEEQITLKYGARFEFPTEYFKSLLNENLEIKFRHQALESYCFNRNGYVGNKQMGNYYYADGINQCERENSSDRTNFVMFQSVNSSLAIINRKLKHYSELYSQHPVQYQVKISELINDELLGGEYSQEIVSFIETLRIVLKRSKCELLEQSAYLFDYKIYNPRLKLNKNFELPLQECYCIGDCSGYSNSLSYAAVTGLILADRMKENENN